MQNATWHEPFTLGKQQKGPWNAAAVIVVCLFVHAPKACYCKRRTLGDNIVGIEPYSKPSEFVRSSCCTYAYRKRFILLPGPGIVAKALVQRAMIL